MIQLEPGTEGPYKQGYWDVTLPQGVYRLHGKEASVLSLLLSGYLLRGDFQPLDAFTTESLEPGRHTLKVVNPDDSGGSG